MMQSLDERRCRKVMATVKKLTNKPKKMIRKTKQTAKQTTQKIGRKGGIAVGAAIEGTTDAKKTRTKMSSSINEFTETAAKTIEKVSVHINDASLMTRDTFDNVIEAPHHLKRQIKRVKN